VLALILLLLLGALGVINFAQTLRANLDLTRPIDPDLLFRLLDIVLLVFIVIELLNIAIAFIVERKVIHTVFEAVLVAVARKIIIAGTEPMELKKAIALAVITLAVGLTWRIVTPMESRELDEPDKHPAKT
jgi:uncharacterized membrane protein (DUF373 family)